jgi:hypothetical protein
MVDVRNRLVKALHTSATLPSLREELVLVLCEMAEHEAAAPTVRSPMTDANVRFSKALATAEDAVAEARAPDTEPDSAPPTPADSDIGKEYGV